MRHGKLQLYSRKPFNCEVFGMTATVYRKSCVSQNGDFDVSVAFFDISAFSKCTKEKTFGLAGVMPVSCCRCTARYHNTKNSLPAATQLQGARVFAESARSPWKRLRGSQLLPLAVHNAENQNGSVALYRQANNRQNVGAVRPGYISIQKLRHA